MSEEDNEEEFSHTFRRYVRSLDRMASVQEKQIKIAEREIAKVHGLALELSSSELRQKLGDHAKKLREEADTINDRSPILKKHASLEIPFDTSVADYKQTERVASLRTRADFYIEWAAHLNPEKTYVISSAEWENLFSLTSRYGFTS